MRPIIRAAASIAGAAALVLPALASAEASFLLSQAGGTASATSAGAGLTDLTLRTGHRRVLAFEERPGRRTGTMREDVVTGLWRGTFRSDPPNAILTGRDTQGRNRRVIVTITRAARTAAGVRYRVRALRGTVPASLRPANLMIDGVPLGAISQYGGAGEYGSLINAMYFPISVTVSALPNVVVTPGTTFTAGSAAGPTVLNVGTLTALPGATVALHPGTRITAQQWVMPPSGVTFSFPGSPTLVTLTAAGLPSCAPDALTFQGTLTQVAVPARPLPTLAQPAAQPWPALGGGTGRSDGSAGCVVTWSFGNPPGPFTTYQSGPVSLGGITRVVPIAVVTTSTTEQSATFTGTGPTTLTRVILTVD